MNEQELKKIEKEIKDFIEKHRTDIEIQQKVDIIYRIEKESIIIIETSPAWDNPEEKIEVPIAKASYDKTGNVWKIFYQNSNLKWEKYKQLPEVKSVSEFLAELSADKEGLFWG